MRACLQRATTSLAGSSSDTVSELNQLRAGIISPDKSEKGGITGLSPVPDAKSASISPHSKLNQDSLHGWTSDSHSSLDAVLGTAVFAVRYRQS
ncbi:hypothetical protein PsYK624_126060 [Phanerochaete sordida]|uniref:Uncharacterized protein n=1 Tax=Phanerochaete sordida TaxID=48140 RepID=A0A9P3GN20_9APHY|nr:hypothetical protein PsYK624_126060 [Phanerochaete sordida]